jgi:lipoprotein-releasing system permease protein
LNLSYFISKRISREQREGFSSTIHKIAIVSIGIGLGATIIAFLIMNGFQETVKNKIYGFNGHIILSKIDTNNSIEESPLDLTDIEICKNPAKSPYVDHIQEYIYKTGLIKTEDEVLGIVIKGVGKNFDQHAFQAYLIEGRFLNLPDSGYANEIVLSSRIANKLRVKVGGDIVVHFFQNPPRLRKLKVVGIYETNLSEYFDDKVVIGDMRMIQKLNDWRNSLAGGVEIFLKDPSYAQQVTDDLDVNYDIKVVWIIDKYESVFGWLNLLSRQVNILLIIILVVVCVNMISIVLILVMERTQMIGMLKALGGSNKLIRSIFIYHGINLIAKGLLFGNALGLGLCYLQYKFKFIKLNPQDYYMDVVPISWHWEIVIFLNVLTFLVVSTVLLIPTMAISRISPIKAIRFD